MSALKSVGNKWTTDYRQLAATGCDHGSLATWALWRRTATDRRLVGVELLQVAHILLLRPVATSCRSMQSDTSGLASTYVWSRPTWARLRLITTSCSKAAIDLRFGRSEHSCVASCRQSRRTAADINLALRICDTPRHIVTFLRIWPRSLVANWFMWQFAGRILLYGWRWQVCLLISIMNMHRILL